MPKKGKQTRQRIISESIQLFTSKGYYNTSVNDILESTGLTSGGLYAHFKCKEDIWFEVYDEAVRIWQGIVFNGVREITDPLERLEKAVENQLKHYIGDNVFAGGCFFLNNLVDLSSQSPKMSRHIQKGLVDFSKLLRSWLKEAYDQDLLKEGLDLKDISEFILITVNGTAALYAANRDPGVWKLAITQLHFYIENLKK